MKTATLSIVLAAACVLIAAASAHAQDAAPATTIKVTTVLHDDGTRTVTKLDPDARTTESSKYDGEKLLQRTVFKLDAQNQPESGDVFDAKGTLVNKVKLVRDDAGRVSEEIRSNPAGQLIGRFVYHYDATGHIAKIDAYDAAGNLIPSNSARSDVKKDRRARASGR
jgi:hypothetical protein